MIKQLLRLVPQNHQSSVPVYMVMLIVYAVAQGVAFALLAPTLEAILIDDLDGARRWLMLILSAIIVVGIAGYAQSLIGLRIGLALSQDLQLRLGDHLNALPLGWFGSTTAGMASRVIVGGTQELVSLFAHLIAPIVTAILIPVTVAIAMIFVDWRISVAMVASAPILYLVQRWGSNLYARSTEGQYRAGVEANTRTIEYAYVQPVLRAFDADGLGSRALKEAIGEQRSANLRAIWSSVPGLVLFSFVVQLTLIPLVWLVITLATRGEVSVPLAVALIVVCTRFVEPLNQAAEMGSSIRRAQGALRRINTLLNTSPVMEPDHPVDPSGTNMEFVDVTFGYGGDKLVLDRVSFTIPSGTTTAIVGPSGSGKTTLLRLAARFYDVEGGCIQLGDVDLRAMASADLLAKVSVVFQDVYLFDLSLLENIRVGRPGASDEDVFRVAKAAMVDEIVARLPDGWETRVGEGGTSLSGGERQRVSIARAMLKNAPVVLLDEATSGLDPQNEIAVVRGIRELSVGTTVLVVAHRLSTIQHADQIVFVENGQVIELGTHEQLLDAGGRYASFWHERKRAAGWRLTDRDGGAA